MSRYLFIVPSFSFGGAEHAVANLSNELVAQGEEVIVVIYFSTPHTYPVDSRVRIVNLSGGDEKCYNQLGYMKKLQMLRRAMLNSNADFILPFLPQVTIHAALAGIGFHGKMIHTIRNNPALTPKNPVKRYVCNYIVSHSKKSIVQNEQQRLYFPKRYKSKIHVLFNPVADDMFEITRNRDHDGINIIGVGRLEEQKNFSLLIRSMKPVIEKHSDARLYIYGTGTQEEALRSLTKSLDIESSVFFMGHTKDIKKAYANADLFVLSSDYEGMPNALIEAMAAGVPSISTDCETGPSDIIDNEENGLLVPVRNAELLAVAILRLIESPSLAEQFTEKGREKIRRICSVTSVVNKLQTICKIN